MSNIQVQLRRGTTAQHGSFTGAQGELTVDTDKNALVLHDGATAGGKVIGSDIVATGSTTARSLEDRFADVVNVMDYGAVGDGTTNDTTAITAAIAAGTVIHFPSGTYLIDEIILTASKTLELADDAVIKSNAEVLADLATPSEDWHLTNTLFSSTTADIDFKIIGGTLDGAGVRPPSAGTVADFTWSTNYLDCVHGPSSNCPDYGEYLLDFDGSKNVTLESVSIKNYLSDGSADAPNGNCCIKIDDVDYTKIKDCFFNQIGNEILEANDTTTNTSFVEIVNTRADSSRGSFNVFPCAGSNISNNNFKNFSGSTINSFTDNATINGNNIDTVVNSHGIDITEGVYKTENIVCSGNIIKNCDDSGIFCKTIDGVFSNNVIDTCNIGITNNIAVVDTSNVQINVIISNNTIIDSTTLGIELQGLGGGVPGQWNGVVISNNILENKDNSLTSAVGIRIYNQAGVTVANNYMDGWLTNHIKLWDRTDAINITGNTFKQAHGAEVQTGDIIYMDGNSDTQTLNNITVQNNIFDTPPPKDKYSVFAENYTHAYGRFPSFTNVSLKDNLGPLMFKNTGGGKFQYASTKSSETVGSTVQGQFCGGDLVLNSITDLAGGGTPTAWKIRWETSIENGLYTYRTAPTDTATFTSGQYTLTMSSNAHGIQIGDGIRITDGDGVGTDNDNEVIRVDDATVYLRTALGASGSGKAVAYLGTAKANEVTISTI